MLTGGHHDRPLVALYSETGYVKDLPRMQDRGRNYHACTSFDNDQGTKVNIGVVMLVVISALLYMQTLIVSGGNNGREQVKTTELLVENSNAWVYTGETQHARWALAASNIDGRIIMTGSRSYEFY